MKRMALSLIVVLTVSSHALAKEKNRAWQNGTVKNSSTLSQYAGQVTNGQTTVYGTTTATSRARYVVAQQYVIDVEGFRYVALEPLKWRWSKPAYLTVNGSVKVAIEKHTLYLIDDDGKKHEANIVKKVLQDH